MFDKEYINKLKDKYNYDDKTIKTLEENSIFVYDGL